MSKTTKQFGDSGVWRGWRELGGDINWEDYGGKWGRQDPSDSNVFYVIKHDNMSEHMSEAELEDSGIHLHVSQVVRVDLTETTDEQIESATECCGVDLEEFDRDAQAWIIVECLVDYGSAAPMGEHTHPHRADVARADARREVEELIGDEDKCNAMLDRPVNLMGSTAREYAAGDMSSAMRRAQEDRQPDDYLPYVVGYMAGVNGGARETGDDLAPEYGQGFERGERVRSGDAQPPPWITAG